MSKHTPGPWRRQGFSVGAGGILIRQSNGPSGQSASVQQALTEERMANARLIAESPEMLRLLKEVYENAFNSVRPDWVKAAEKLIDRVIDPTDQQPNGDK